MHKLFNRLTNHITAVKSDQRTSGPADQFLLPAVDDRKNEENFESAKLAQEDLFKLLEEKFPSSEIYISELFIRGERHMDKHIDRYNEYLRAACRKRGNFRVLRHQESIDDRRRHLRDDKHLSRSGFGEFSDSQSELNN